MNIIIEQPFYLAVATMLGIAIALINYVVISNRAQSVDRSLARGLGQSLWELTDSGPSNYFFDVDTMLSVPSDIKYVTNWFVQKITEVKRKVGHIDYIAFIEKDSGPVGVLSHKDLLVAKTNIPAIVVRVRRRLVRAAIKGESPPGERLPMAKGDTIVILSDVTTTGSQIGKAATLLKRYGVDVPYAIVVLDREEGAEENLRAIGIEIMSLRKYSYLKEKGLVSNKVLSLNR
jgi:orotate phosphoribosyltransferase